MDFHAVARRFWDRWLKGIENGAENDPQVVAYLVDAPRPAPRREHDAGRWVAIDRWDGASEAAYRLAGGGRLVPADYAGPDAPEVILASPTDPGVMGGEYLPLTPGVARQGDHRRATRRHVPFTNEPLGP